MRIKVVKINEDILLPKYKTEGAAAVDLHSTTDIILPTNNVIAVPTGLKVEIPEGYELQIRQRSGLGKKGIIIPNSPGTIDSDFRGEVHILLLNLSTEDFEIKKGDRIAQAVLNKFEKIDWDEVKELTETERGEGAFGSTGV
ncbi:dUTP diphosphatase [Candidatus Woesearchaeota archaeon]|jgi:dUTP pyrophosphatase|nr:dUTP diphosphatase [Candidatus Woesearchaeota archaeon]MBT7062452.1 dUTP diphosphatase [Candidatus Woesearchaeota archaeon]MBT7402967.1 dUTP diphosphatase [Candidatus Woesearchaeota archaeon]